MQSIRYRVKPLWKESSNHFTGRVVLVALEPGAVLVRLKGKRMTYRIPIDYIFEIGALLEARRYKAEKEAARKARRKGNS